VKLVSTGLLILALSIALVPEFRRYAAERRLYVATAVFQSIVARHQVAAPEADALDWAVATSIDAADGIPGDSRPLILAGSARLIAQRPSEALVLYKRALDLGERAEIDLNMGRAYFALGDQQAASSAIIRAAWVSPAIVSVLPEQARPPVTSALAQDEELLLHRRLSAPPPLPSDSSR